MNLAAISVVPVCIFLASAMLGVLAVKISLNLPLPPGQNDWHHTSVPISSDWKDSGLHVQEVAQDSNSSSGLVSLSNLQLSSSNFKFPVQSTPDIPSTHALACICKEADRFKCDMSPREIKFC